MTNQELGEWVKRELGYPTRNVELTEEQLNDAITFALQEIQPYYTGNNYLTIDLNGKTAIDLSEYEVYEVSDVIVIPDNLRNGQSSQDSMDPFNSQSRLYAVGGFGTIGNTYISNLTNSSVHHIMSAYSKNWNEGFYSKLAYILQQRTAGSTLPGMDYQYIRSDKTLYLDVGYPKSSTVTIEYIIYLKSFDQLRDQRYIRIAQDLALSNSLTKLSRITGKYDVSNAPSKVNYEMYREDAKELLESARQRLKNISRTVWITD